MLFREIFWVGQVLSVLNQELGPFDATIHAPAFLEGGRTTINGVHLLNGLPVHMTRFASDSVFGYSTSHLDVWLEDKSGGKILSKDVLSQAMRYSSMNGGKRIRPFIVSIFADIADIPKKK